MKRLGDGFTEQQLVRDQILNLTGKQYLAGFTSDEEQFKDLMNNAAIAADKFDLTVGIGLTAEQMANLTTDIVWMVEKEVDGQMYWCQSSIWPLCVKASLNLTAHYWPAAIFIW